MTLVHSPAAHTQPGSAKTVADILTAAADLIAQPGGWTQGAFARGPKERLTGWRMEDAVCFCTAGAIYRSAGAVSAADRAVEVMNRRAARSGFENVARWNDAEGRTQAEVVAALRSAAAKASGESQ